MQKQLKRGSTYARMSAKSSAEIRKFRFWKGGQYRPEYATLFVAMNTFRNSDVKTSDKEKTSKSQDKIEASTESLNERRVPAFNIFTMLRTKGDASEYKSFEKYIVELSLNESALQWIYESEFQNYLSASSFKDQIMVYAKNYSYLIDNREYISRRGDTILLKFSKKYGPWVLLSKVFEDDPVGLGLAKGLLDDLCTHQADSLELGFDVSKKQMEFRIFNTYKKNEYLGDEHIISIWSLSDEFKGQYFVRARSSGGCNNANAYWGHYFILEPSGQNFYKVGKRYNQNLFNCENGGNIVLDTVMGNRIYGFVRCYAEGDLNCCPTIEYDTTLVILKDTILPIGRIE